MTDTVRVNGVDLAVERHGTRTGAPLVMVHGWSGSRGGWATVLDGLTASHEVITYDHRGHGGSSKSGREEGYTIDQLVDDFLAVTDELGLQSFHLLGHSLGGLVSMRYALERPERVRSLLLVDTGATPSSGAQEWMDTLVEVVRTQGLDAYYDMVLPYVGAPGPEGERARDMFRADLDSLDPAAFTSLALELTRYEPILDRLPELRIPTTVVVGENDAGLRPAADELVAAIGGAVLDVIGGAGHSPHVDDPQAWLAAVERHFRRLEQ